MASSKLPLFLCATAIVIHLAALTFCQQDTPLDVICVPEMGNFTKRSTYQTNLNRVLVTLSNNTKINYGFYTASYGQNSNRVNAMVLCRGDVNPDNCHSCIRTATPVLRKHCPNQKEAVIWYDYCMVRYSYRYFFGNMEFGPWFWMYNLNNVSDASSFNRDVATLLDSLKDKAATGDNCRKFATGDAESPTNSVTIYALVQCTPDLSKQQCIDCLNNATALLPNCCDGRQGGRVIAPSCNFRYEIGRFYGLDVTC